MKENMKDINAKAGKIAIEYIERLRTTMEVLSYDEANPYTFALYATTLEHIITDFMLRHEDLITSRDDFFTHMKSAVFHNIDRIKKEVD